MDNTSTPMLLLCILIVLGIQLLGKLVARKAAELTITLVGSIAAKFIAANPTANSNTNPNE